LAALNGRFEALYSSMGRPSIPPEMLLRATLLPAAGWRGPHAENSLDVLITRTL
jgi:hypothetical protein